MTGDDQVTGKHRCSEFVYRGTYGPGNGCAKPAKVQDPDGMWWCTIHDPARVAAKKAAREARRDAEETARQNAYVAAVKVARTFTAAGYPAVADRNIWGDTVVRLDVDAARRLAERLTERLTE